MPTFECSEGQVVVAKTSCCDIIDASLLFSRRLKNSTRKVVTAQSQPVRTLYYVFGRRQGRLHVDRIEGDDETVVLQEVETAIKSCELVLLASATFASFSKPIKLADALRIRRFAEDLRG